ncbi:PIN domain-containing protein [Thermodesulfatator autotrophicus]|uniref:PIN domain-containing protein n=1 Tax=Thermodesulfatator autotrophicus TaxID=1795632 RepID=A0A177E5G8_9BACT|nr:PIN domain-containing protein [Thermodesulfatator autotrophicus]OAG27018.1 hypothetical protein TH606_09040 [Thermodesulfatator autotrophicus]
MKLVVDTNIIFSALLRKESKELLILKSSSFQFFTPKIVFIELFKYKEKILKYTHLQEDEVIELFQIIFEDIKVIDESQIPYGFRKLGYDLTKNIDIEYRY